MYIGWSDVRYLWSQCDHHFVGEHVVLCVVKWWRFVASFESNWISSFKKLSVLSLSYWESDVCKHFAEVAPQNGGKQLIWRNYVIVTLCIQAYACGTRFVVFAYCSCMVCVCVEVVNKKPVVCVCFHTPVCVCVCSITVVSVVACSAGLAAATGLQLHTASMCMLIVLHSLLGSNFCD